MRSVRLTSGGVLGASNAIASDLRKRKTGLQRPHVRSLANLAACMLECRSVNTSELLELLPRLTEKKESRYRFINCWLKNALIKPDEVMAGFVPELISCLAEGGKKVVLIEKTKARSRTDLSALKCAQNRTAK